ncbi:phage terminase large subunit family protein [Hominiventricola aquisgranensis]|jgi:phage terminase large subunit (gpA)|uniref:Phage terminase large subunit family protein n=1 Tax=Hominiventricola aquisgranensis TaxID=3133164 RepID=A0ABV1HZG3_9FIRM|nr:phage terminase large subunit family protein [Clostridiaceae bacterium AF42-6]
MARRKKIPVTQYQYEALQYLSPPEQLTVSEWAEKYRILDAKSSAMPGPWSNDITPYLKGVMDEFNNYETEKIVFVKPTQVGGTEALQNMIGYIVMQDPAPTMIVYPTDTLAKSISENRLQPMLKATPEIAKKFDDTSPLLELQFDGMYLTLAGSNSPSGLASKPIRFLMMDEVDKYPGASNKEADPIKLATERTKTFHNKKIYITSTPTLKTGHIWKEKEDADIEKHFFVPCPHCGEYIELLFPNIRFPDDEGMSYADRAEFATYVCQKCGCVITDNDKHNMLKLGEWRTVRHSTKYVRNVAFWINTLYSPFVRWSDIAKEFLQTKDNPEDFQNFVNSWLAEPWEDTKLKTNADLVMERQTDLPAYVVPSWTKLLTAGVDVQETCLYWTIRAWGDYLTSQNIAHGQALSFQEIDQIMNLQYQTEDGDPVVVNLCLVDSGDQTDMVYDFCVTHADYALPVKGSNHAQLSPYKLSKISKVDSKAYGMTLVIADGNAYKDMIAGRMKRPNGRGSWMVYAGCDMEYAQQVTAEHKINVKKNGVVRQVWVPKRSHVDNHYLDAEVYALAAADIREVRTLHLRNEDPEELLTQKNEEPETPEEQWIRINENWLGG